MHLTYLGIRRQFHRVRLQQGGRHPGCKSGKGHSARCKEPVDTSQSFDIYPGPWRISYNCRDSEILSSDIQMYSFGLNELTPAATATGVNSA